MTEGADPDARAPMVIAVHGLGDRPEYFESLDGLDQPLRIVLPRTPKPYFRGYSRFDIQLPFRDAAESAAPGIAAAADLVAALTQQLSAHILYLPPCCCYTHENDASKSTTFIFTDRGHHHLGPHGNLPH